MKHIFIKKTCTLILSLIFFSLNYKHKDKVFSNSQCQGTKVPEDESSTYGTSFPGTKVLEYESSMNPLRGTHF